MLHPGALACCALPAACLAPPTRARSTSPAQAMLASPLVVNLGAFALNTDLSRRLDGQPTRDPDADFDGSLGRDDNASRVRTDVLWRITPTHHLPLMYFGNQRDASRMLDHDVRWGDHTFQAGSRIDSRVRFDITELTCEDTVLKWADFELAGSLGVHDTQRRIGLSGAATVTDADGNLSAVTPSAENSDRSAPRPLFGLRAARAASPQSVLDLQGQHLEVTVDGNDGKVSDLRAGVPCMAARHFGIGVGCDRFVTRIGVDRDTFNGRPCAGPSGLRPRTSGAS